MMRTLLVGLAIAVVALTGWLFQPRIEKALTDVKAHINAHHDTDTEAAPEAAPEAPEAAPEVEADPESKETETASPAQPGQVPVAVLDTVSPRWF